ncbi:MAG TPA: T9SS type B sorting domain-containing protein, partial [Phaeodactylibacter sp.]|nr:T9SS type B sorting domain-containing protein [Phaeodactylibacter sp.]
NTSAPVLNVEWIFEGGTPATSTDLEPQVVFENVGNFDVTLIVDNGSCIDTLVKSDYIKIGAIPVADFIMTPDDGCAPLSVTFKNMSSVSAGTIQSWDWDFGNGATSDLQDAEHIFTEGGDMPIRMRVTTGGGCQDSITKMLHVFPVTTLGISEDTTICQGETANLIASILSDTTGVNYYWKPDATLSCTDCFAPTVNPMDTTTYTFVAVSPEGCTYEADVTVNVRNEAVPVLTISNDTTICANDVAQLFVTGGDDIFGYNWDASASGLTCYDACNNPIASPISNTTYTVTVTNISGCSSTASTNVSVFYEFQNILGADRTICLGDTAELHIATGNDPEWLVSDGLSCSQCPEPVASPMETTTFVVRVKSDFGCDIIDSLTVNIFSPDDMDAGGDIDICLGQTAQLTGFGEGIPSWSPAATLNQTDILNPIASPTENTTYYFSLENGDCVMTDSMRVRIIEKTEIELLDQTICEGETVVMQPIGFADTYQWSPPERLTVTDIENPLASPQEDTRYTVVAQLGTCPPDTASAIIEVLEKPKVAVASVYPFFPGEPVLLTVERRGIGDYAYQWSPATGLSCTDCASPTAMVDSAMNYVVLITNVLNGCTTAKEVKVRRINECSDELISMPNAFSPNGDGENDLYRIYSGAVDDIDYFRVFNRWGVLVYETNDRYGTWDGKMNGKLLPEGVYIYVLSAKCKLDGSTILKKGDITIHY